MGYYAQSLDAYVAIRKEEAEDFIHSAESNGMFLANGSLTDNLEYQGFDWEDADDGVVEIVSFSGKWRDQEKFLQSLAPFVNDCGSIEFRGEENELWRYSFQDGEMTISEGAIIWE